MDINVLSSPNAETLGGFTRACQYVTSLLKNFKDNVVNFALEAKKLGQDDPRKLYHALKVGLAITVVSLFYYFQPLYNGFGVSAMWAVITVVVVFEYTVGATLGKGINRVVSTIVAGYLGVVAHYLADLSGRTGEPILLALFGFIVASIFTFMRFFPKLKARYDYGLMIFILTFALVAVSGYRDDEVIQMAQQRLSTVLIGSCIAMLICILISPVWAGAELHNLVASNIEKLGNFLEGFGSEFMKTKDQKPKEEASFRQQYKSVLGTKSNEETMANLASWEPGHGNFKFLHPWKQYLKVGALIRHCACRVDALNNCLNSDVQQTPTELQETMKEACKNLSYELGKVLLEVALGLKKMKKTSIIKTQFTEAKVAAQELKSLLQDRSLWEKFNFLDILPVATVASMLIDIVDCVENIIEAAHELASMAGFKSVDSASMAPGKELQQIIVVREENDQNNHVPEKRTTSSADSERKT